jgi:hypothetical protein
MTRRFFFPRWTNRFVVVLLIGILGFGAYAGAVTWFAIDPQLINVGYSPRQPLPFSHEVHAGKLKMDCRYCHNTVERAGHAAIPPTATCGNCHSPKDEQGIAAKAAVLTDSPKLELVRESIETGQSIPWIKVHNLPDFVYFNHSAHVTAGVSCVSCHGRVDQMAQVAQVETLSMKWCLNCHRNPDPHLRPVDKVTQLDWTPADDPEFEGMTAEEVGALVREELDLSPDTSCSTCHR